MRLLVPLILAMSGLVAAPAASALPRSFADRPDDVGGQQIHAIYLLASDSPDRRRDVRGEIAGSIAVAQEWMERKTARRFRLDTFEGELDVSTVVLPERRRRLAEHGIFLRDEFEARLPGLGFDDEDKLYAVYYEGFVDEVCANGPYPPELPGRVAAHYLDGRYADPGIPDCAEEALAAPGQRAGAWEHGFLHELIHATGAVPYCAPNASDAHVGDDPRDLMYAGPEPWNPRFVDIGRNDYFGHGRRGCLDLALSGFLEGNRSWPVPDGSDAWRAPRARRCAMPDVTGRRVRAARRLLRAWGCPKVALRVRRVRSFERSKRIVRQRPRAGRRLTRRSEIRLRVAR